LPGLNNKVTEQFRNVEIKNNNMGLSLAVMSWYWMNNIEKSWFNYTQHMNLLTGKVAWFTKAGASTTDKPGNKADQNSISQFFVDTRPVKVINKKGIDGDVPFQVINITDSSESFIKNIDKNLASWWSVLGLPSDDNGNKSERRITDEISIQNILESSILTDMLNSRQKSAKEMNKEFGWNVSVELIDNFYKSNLEPGEVPEQNGGDNNELI